MSVIREEHLKTKYLSYCCMGALRSYPLDFLAFMEIWVYNSTGSILRKAF